MMSSSWLSALGSFLQVLWIEALYPPALDSTNSLSVHPEILLGDKHILCQLLLDLQAD